MKRVFQSIGLLAAALLCAGCGNDPENPYDRTRPPFVHSGDLDEVVRRGRLRVLRPRRVATPHLPRQGDSLTFERELVESFAAGLSLETVWIYVDSREELLHQLLLGRGDLIVANLTVTAERKRRVDFTVPVATVREQLVSRVGDPTVDRPDNLAGRTIAVRRSSSFWDTVQRLQRRYPSLELEEVPEEVDTEEIVHRVARGEYDLTVADSNLVQACLEYRDDIQAALDLTEDRRIAWAVRPGSQELLNRLNQHLSQVQLASRTEERHTDDFPGIARRRVLRMLTRNSASTYFLWRGELVGFEYELMKEFARRKGLRLEVIVPPANEDLLEWLRDGRGDVVAAALAPPPPTPPVAPEDELRSQGVDYTRPYNFVSRIVVGRRGDELPETLAELAGRRLAVKSQSAHWNTLEELRGQGVELDIVEVPPEMPTEELIAEVAAGTYDLTLVDSHVLGIELTWRDDIAGVQSIGDAVPHAWAVRSDNPELRAALDAYLDSEYRSLLYNVIYDRYFRSPIRVRDHLKARIDGRLELSPYDELVRKHAARFGFDWRLIVAMMYQESRFDPGARSFAGARGLMQILPGTAEELGITELHDPESGIEAGVMYLDWVRERFEDELPVKDRMWFTLAAYNAGAGHVRDARRLAREVGLNPDQWFDNVEHAMLLLSRPQYAEASSHGYCRCLEPVRYVAEVRARYKAYVDGIGS